MKRESLERYQVWVYVLAITVGLMLGNGAPGAARVLEHMLWPALALLMYATFTQIPLAQLPAAFKDIRFVLATLVGNFVILPILVATVLLLVPDHTALRLGLVLVLLVPCTDWFITFTQQGGGDARRALAITPLLLIAQMALLPLYLWLFMGPEVTSMVSTSHMAGVFAAFIVAPLAAALLTQRWCARHSARAALLDRMAWLPLPLLALVLSLVAASQVHAVWSVLHAMSTVLIACIAFLIGAVVCSVMLGKAFNLPVSQARTLLFSMCTRNSFVVLPFALALPTSEQVAAQVIVLQSLIELFGLLMLLWLVPRRLLPQASTARD